MHWMNLTLFFGLVVGVIGLGWAYPLAAAPLSQSRLISLPPVAPPPRWLTLNTLGPNEENRKVGPGQSWRHWTFLTGLGGAGVTLTLGKLVRELRQRKGLTQRQLADRCEVSPTYVSLIEKGARYPAEELCVKLGTELDYDAREFALRSRTIKSPVTAQCLYGQGNGRHSGDNSGKGNGGDFDPDLEALRRRLLKLRTSMAEESYARLLISMMGILDAYDSREAPADSSTVRESTATSDPSITKRRTRIG